MTYQSIDERRRYQREYYQKKLKPRRDNQRYERHQDEKKTILSMRAPISLVARIRRIVNEGIATGKFPWKTQTDCTIALIIKGLESMAGDPTIDEIMPYLRAVQEIEVVATHRKEAQAAFSRIKTEIAALLEIKARDEAVKYYHSMYDSVHDMDENVWSDWLLKQLTTTFPDLMKEKPKRVRFESAREMAAARAHARTHARQLGRRKLGAKR